MFEQSGTFKNEFKKLGINAVDCDIQNNFGETDFDNDLFAEIENAYEGKPSLFDNITPDDLIIAFFPCIYFETLQMTYYQLDSVNINFLPMTGRIEKAIERLQQRTYMHTLLYKLLHVAYKNGLRLIIENPATPPTTLLGRRIFQSQPLSTKTEWNAATFSRSQQHIGL